MKKIKSISFLHEGSRLRAYCTATGKFKVEDSDILVSAMDLVTNRFVKSGDPVLTLEDGEKVRVYQGGDPGQFVVTAVSILENHERRLKLRDKLLGKAKKKTEKKTEKTYKQMSMGFNHSYPGRDVDTIDDDIDDDQWGFDYLCSLWLSND